MSGRKPIISGHYHEKSFSPALNISYLGAPYALKSHEYNVYRGFHILDTCDLDLEFIPNPLQIFGFCILDDMNKAISAIKSAEIASTLDIIVTRPMTLGQRVILENLALKRGFISIHFWETKDQISELCEKLFKIHDYGNAYKTLTSVKDTKINGLLSLKLIICKLYLATSPTSQKSVSNDFQLWVKKVFLNASQHKKEFYASYIATHGIDIHKEVLKIPL